MIISYNINKINYKATFCNNKESPDIYKALSKLYCDKKLLLIIDKKLNAKFTKFLFKDYTMHAESRRLNYWAVIVSVVIVLVTLGLFFRKR